MFPECDIMNTEDLIKIIETNIYVLQQRTEQVKALIDRIDKVV